MLEKYRGLGTLRRLGKTEQLARELKHYWLSILAVTETTYQGKERWSWEEESGYTMIFAGSQDECNMEGVGLALTPHARATMQYHQAVLKAEFLTKVGPLLIVVAHAPTDQDSTEEKDRFYSDLDRVMSNDNGLAIVMEDFNVSASERMKRVVRPHGLVRCTYQ